MLTKLTLRNFKRFDDVEVLLDRSVVFVGPNNSGKTTALQALALWDFGVKRWLEKRGTTSKATERTGVTIGRSELSVLPVPDTNLLWKNKKFQKQIKKDGHRSTDKIFVEVIVEGIDGNHEWKCGLEFERANEESIRCRSLKSEDGRREEVPGELAGLRLAFLPPMSGLSDREYIKQPGEIGDLVGQGRTADVLRNLCQRVRMGSDGELRWGEIRNHIRRLFPPVELNDPERLPNDRLILTYKDGGPELDISCSGRGLQQTLLLLTHLYAHPGSVWLLDEPDAHLEFIRQGQTYDLIAEVAEAKNCQVIIATHSEKVLNVAAERHEVVAFTGKPHAVGGKTGPLMRALKEIPFDEYLQAEQLGWILYLEGSTDLALLRAFADRLNHPVREFLDRIFVKPVGNQQAKAETHFEALVDAIGDLNAYLLLDRQESPKMEHPRIKRHLWTRREFENYICQPAILLAYAEHLAKEHAAGPLFEEGAVIPYRKAMEEALKDRIGSKPLTDMDDVYWKNTKVSDDLIPFLIKDFCQRINVYNEMSKGDYHSLVRFIPEGQIDAEVIQVLDEIHLVALTARSLRLDRG